jgi:hypothetical protein
VAIPDFISDTVNAPGNFSESLSATSTILATIRSKLVTTPVSAVWTEPSANLFKSKVDSSGWFFDVLMTAVDADSFEFRVRDKDANIICTRRILIEAAGNTTVEYYWGNYYLVIVSRRATAELAQAYLLDPTAVGDTAASVGNRVVGTAHRSTGEAVDVNGTSNSVGGLWAWDNGASALAWRVEHRGEEVGSTGGTTPAARSLISASGRCLNVPANIYVNQAGNRRITGALPCCLVVDSTLSFDAVRNGPLDGSTTRKMIVLPFAVANRAMRLAIRKPSLDA